MHTGSCGCGEVQFKLNSEVMNVVNCHCNMCRQHNGSAFSTYVALPFSSLEFTKGSNSILSYTIKSAKKHFCQKCGTPLFNLNEKYPGACMIFLGVLAFSRDLAAKINVWCESQLAWVNAISELPAFPHGVERASGKGQ